MHFFWSIWSVHCEYDLFKTELYWQNTATYWQTTIKRKYSNLTSCQQFNQSVFTDFTTQSHICSTKTTGVSENVNVIHTKPPINWYYMCLIRRLTLSQDSVNSDYQSALPTPNSPHLQGNKLASSNAVTQPSKYGKGETLPFGYWEGRYGCALWRLGPSKNPSKRRTRTSKDADLVLRKSGAECLATYCKIKIIFLKFRSCDLKVFPLKRVKNQSQQFVSWEFDFVVFVCGLGWWLWTK